jgi:hypothetical protein
MSARRLRNRLFYFTVEDESILAEAFSKFEDDVYAIAYKVAGTDDVFVTTGETKEAMDRNDVPYNLLAEEDASRVPLYHSPLSREELGEFEDAIRALALAHRAIALACVGVNGETNLGFDLSEGPKQYTYFAAPAGHTFIWRLFFERDDAVRFLDGLTFGERRALDWAAAIPLATASELRSYH